jgi:hypothetical protein
MYNASVEVSKAFLQRRIKFDSFQKALGYSLRCKKFTTLALSIEIIELAPGVDFKGLLPFQSVCQKIALQINCKLGGELVMGPILRISISAENCFFFS